MPQKASRPTSSDRSALPVEEAPNAQLLQIYRRLVLARQAEQRIRDEYAKDEMKTPVHLGIGQEAIPVGVHACLPPGTKTFGTYRNHALYLAVTGDAEGFFAELYGKASGPGKGKAGSMHMASPDHGLLATSAVVGTTIPVAVGAALADGYRGLESLTAVFFGDGAVEEGVFWESLNFACLRRLRVLFVCEDNGLAIHTPTAQRQGFRSIVEAVGGFDCHVMNGDGSSVSEVMAVTGQLLQKMTEQPKPGFLHLTYLRLLEHVGPREDFAVGYRREPTAEERERLDPVLNLERELLQQGVALGELAVIKASVETEIDLSVRAARSAPFAPASELYTDVWAP